MANRLFNLFSENQTLINSCPVCNLKFNPLEAKVLAERDSSYLVHVKCHHCQSLMLAVVSLGEMGASSVGIITDLIGEDVIKFRKLKPISWDEVILAHEFLKKENITVDQFDN
ncbi:MAG: hypothetical protein WCX71_04220 [Candidatus Buchananbacteria bacterium]